MTRVRADNDRAFAPRRAQPRSAHFAVIYRVLGLSGVVAMGVLATVALLSFWGSSARHPHDGGWTEAGPPSSVAVSGSRSEQPLVHPVGSPEPMLRSEQPDFRTNTPNRTTVDPKRPPTLLGLAPAAGRGIAGAASPVARPSDLAICIEMRPAERRLAPADIARLLKSSRELLEQGKLADARLGLQMAAEACDPEAALRLASTYDPVALPALGIPAGAADRALARGWYEQASRLGSAEAADRLERLP
jgi:hypothetical protein